MPSACQFSISRNWWALPSAWREADGGPSI